VRTERKELDRDVNQLSQYGAVERKVVRHSYAGTEDEVDEEVGTMIEGTETRADIGFRIAFVVTCHSIASSGLSNPSGRAFKRLCI